MFLRHLTCVFLTILLCCFPCHVWATSDDRTEKSEYLNLSLGTGIEYESGDYGTETTIDTWQIPLIIEWAPLDRLSLSLDISYIYQSGTNETVIIGGTPTPILQGSGQGNGDGSGGSGGSGSGGGGSTVEQSSSSEEGLGDMNLSAALTLIKEGAETPRLLALVYGKIPTADDQKGLGTGEFDWGGGLGLGKKFGAWSTYAEMLVIQPGSSEDYDPNAYQEWFAALNYRLSSRLQTGISLSGGTAPFDDTDDPLEVKVKLSGISGEHTSFSGYVLRGMSDSSPDWGIGILGYLDF